MKICVNCQKEYSGRNSMYCCQKCRVEKLRALRPCVVCGAMFWASPSSDAKTCCQKCSIINKKSIDNVTRLTSLLPDAHKAFYDSDKTGQCETNIHAKTWVIKSPDGAVYEINNLALWCKEHEHILPNDAKRFSCGIRDIKRSITGAKKNKSYSYMGWTLVSYFDYNVKVEEYYKSKKEKHVKMTEQERLEKKRERARRYYQNKKSKQNIDKQKKTT